MAMSMIRIYNRNHVYLRFLPLVLPAVCSFYLFQLCVELFDLTLEWLFPLCRLRLWFVNENTKQRKTENSCSIAQCIQFTGHCETLRVVTLKLSYSNMLGKKRCTYTTGIKKRSKKKRNMRARRTTSHAFFTICFCNGKSSIEATL